MPSHSPAVARWRGVVAAVATAGLGGGDATGPGVDIPANTTRQPGRRLLFRPVAVQPPPPPRPCGARQHGRRTVRGEGSQVEKGDATEKWPTWLDALVEVCMSCQFGGTCLSSQGQLLLPSAQMLIASQVFGTDFETSSAVG